MGKAKCCLKPRWLMLLIFFSLLGCAVVKETGPAAEQQARQLVDQGVLSLRSGDLERAEASFRVAYETKPLAAALDGLGCVAFMRGNAESAETYFVQAWQSEENYYTALANLALLYESRGLYSEAQKMYQMAIDGDPQNFRARNNLAAFLYDSVYVSDGPDKIEDELRRKRIVKNELLKAEALTEDPIIEKNLKEIE